MIPDIAYHGALVDIPAAQVANLMEQRTVALALADDIMFLRPQEACFGGRLRRNPRLTRLRRGWPPRCRRAVRWRRCSTGCRCKRIHCLPTGWSLTIPITCRRGRLWPAVFTALRWPRCSADGDRNEGGSPLSARFMSISAPYCERQRPGAHGSRPAADDTLCRAVLRIKGSEGQEAVAPSVFLMTSRWGTAGGRSPGW